LEGFISIHLVEDGWFWLIPLRDGVMSVGFVGNRSAFAERRGSPHALLMDRIARSPSVAARMRNAEMLTEAVGTGNFSYESPTLHGPGWLMVGDSFAFLDPVFSSGVLLAMNAAEMGAEVADTWLDDPARGAVMARRMERDVRHAMKRISWLIYRINTPALRMLFMEPANRFRMRDGLISLLAGNLRGTREMMLPVLAFKGMYHLITLMLRLGVNTGLAPQVGGGSR
jgi:flavin-dependent dehydrogenase